MLVVLSDFPDNVLAVSASGKVTAMDYHEVIEPAVLAKLKAHKHLNFYYRLGSDFSSFSAGAIWEDTKIGIAHWSGWDRIAVVTDVIWIADAVRLFSPLFHHPVRVFGNAEEHTARAWIAQKEA
jgi:hypothetical protein